MKEQLAQYKGFPLRAWVKLHLTAPDGTSAEVEPLADTGNPCAIIISRDLMKHMKHRWYPNLETNFGILEGGWLHVTLPELGFDRSIEGFASDSVVTAARTSCEDFDGLIGLPLLRWFEYGGNSDQFWLRSE